MEKERQKDLIIAVIAFAICELLIVAFCLIVVAPLLELKQ